MSKSYRPLTEERGEIRLLRLKAAGSEESVRCWLSTVSLLEELHLQYETISYCWGNPADRVLLYLNDLLVSVPRSSERALRRIRLPDEDRTVWIDALCINQDDLVEKGIQVKLMGMIYRRGSGNLIFLGDDEEGVAENTVAVLRQATLEIENLASTLSDEEQRILIQKGKWPITLAEHDAVPEKAQLNFLAPLFTLSWFKRVWVVQEACLARNNTCFWGNQCFMLHDALRLLSIKMSHVKSVMGDGSTDSFVSAVDASVLWTLFDLTPQDNASVS